MGKNTPLVNSRQQRNTLREEDVKRIKQKTKSGGGSEWSRQENIHLCRADFSMILKKGKYPNWRELRTMTDTKHVSSHGLAHLACTAEAKKLLLLLNCLRTNSAIRSLLLPKPK